MASHFELLLLFIVSLLSTPSASHFVLQAPPSLGFDSNSEDDSPCGGPDLSFSNASDYHAGGDAVALTTLHPQSNFLFRGQLQGSAQNNWTNLLPVVQESGLGSFCESSVAVPPNWVGQTGVLQVIQDAEDGVHYQCAAVNFIAGTATSLPSSCQNASGLTANFGSDTTLEPATSTRAPSSPTGSASNAASMSMSMPMSSSTASATSAAPASTTSASSFASRMAPVTPVGSSLILQCFPLLVLAIITTSFFY